MLNILLNCIRDSNRDDLNPLSAKKWIFCTVKFANLKLKRTFALPFEKGLLKRWKEVLKKTGAKINFQNFAEKFGS